MKQRSHTGGEPGKSCVAGTVIGCQSARTLAAAIAAQKKSRRGKVRAWDFMFIGEGGKSEEPPVRRATSHRTVEEPFGGSEEMTVLHQTQATIALPATSLESKRNSDGFSESEEKGVQLLRR
jgi:hypothetical protein